MSAPALPDDLALVDSHAHVVPSVFGDELPAVIARAAAAGVREIICIGSGYGPESAAEAIEVAGRFDGVHAAVGLHPHDAAHGSREHLAALDAQAARAGVVGWGEIGLDYHYDHSPRPVQREVFAAQIALAQARGLPVIIHTREADDDTLAILDETNAWPGGVLIHCFSHTPEFARALLDRGAYLSIPGIVTFNKAEALRQAVREAPLERLMIETDSPFLAPIPHRGKRNEPAFVRRVAETIADLKHLPLATVATTTTATARTFFRL